MPRSSRHKSHRSHKHTSRDARERSDSEDNENSRYRKQRVEEARVSKDVESDKAKSSSLLPSSHEKSKAIIENGDCSAEHGKKRKERGDDCVTPDRWNGSGKDESFGLLDAEKGEKSKLLSVESKSRSSRRREGSVERYSRSESLKRRSEKEYSRREIREEKERDVERVSESEKDKEREKRVGDGRHGKSDDVETRNQGSRRGGGGEEERLIKKDSIGKVT